MLLFILDFLRLHLRGQGQASDLGPLRVFQYISVRSGSALVVAFAASLILGPRVISGLRQLKASQFVRKSTGENAVSLHEMHGGKQGTPTMGGILIILALFIAVALFCRLSSPAVWSLTAMSLGFGALGFWDDYVKVARKNHLGIPPWGKIAGQTLLGALFGVALMRGRWSVSYETTGAEGYAYLLVPFFKNFYPYLGAAYLLWVVIVMIGASNAVNLTDGLDGLAIGTTVMSAVAYIVMAYLASRADWSSYLYIPYVPDAGEIAVFGSALLGASLGFLWFNSHPAEVFMGDTGSMMLGGALGAMALLIKQEILLVLIGGIFVAEALSVIIQVASFKLTGKRVFRMSPLHHHYEKLGLHENKIILRFWTVSFLLALFGLATLKLR